MNLYIQMGYGMQGLSKELCKVWSGATVILSPKNIYPSERLATYAASMHNLNGKVLFDPQLYSPLKYHKNLQQHEYWPSSGTTDMQLGDYNELLKALDKVNVEIGSEAFILPSTITNSIDERWGEQQRAIISQAREISSHEKLMLTVALGEDVLNNEHETETIVQFAMQWDVNGVYIVCEHPKRYYFVEKPIWIANLLSLVAGLKRQGKTVIVGYASHQMLPLALAKCDAIASGSFLNTRWFQPESFETAVSEEQSRRSTWYYCPQALSEYKVTLLDIANRQNILHAIAPPPMMANDYSSILFAGATPSSTNFNEGSSFRHYLYCLKIQCELASKPSYVETRNALFAQLETADRIISGLRAQRISGQSRDFSEIVDTNAAAMHSFDMEYRYALSREWDVL